MWTFLNANIHYSIIYITTHSSVKGILTDKLMVVSSECVSNGVKIKDPGSNWIGWAPVDFYLMFIDCLLVSRDVLNRFASLGHGSTAKTPFYIDECVKYICDVTVSTFSCSF